MTTATRGIKAPDTRPFWRRHFLKLTLTPLGAAIAIWFLVLQPRTTKTVDEAFPTAAPVQTAITAAQPAAPTAQAIVQPPATIAPATAQRTATTAPATAGPRTAPIAAQPTAIPAQTPAPAPSGPVALKRGDFAPALQSGSGTATIYRQADGSYLLRLENFSVTNGPDLRVRLLGPNGASLDLGGLKGNKGNQNYDLPADFDPARYDAADIWCRAFHEQFTKAPLA